MVTPPKLVLATDLDGTFLGGSESQRRALYDRLATHRDRVHLIFVTGRDLPHIDQLCKAPGFPLPDHIVGDVGTTVVDGRSHQPVAAIQDWIATCWADGGPRAHALLRDTPGLSPQPGTFAYRASYYYEPDVLDPDVPERVRRAGFDCIVSADTFLDVLPPGVSKGPSLLRLLDHLGLPRDRVLVAGDTLNDLSLFQTGLRGVVVGNAEKALRDATEGLPHVHHSPAPGAAGILDALDHHDLAPWEDSP
ncbi:MAG: HAD hydrolase family protein [Alphaproteobacteria bacterium]|nr:HAD hydrolase family protein [Alphaproteobacteria bacterium]